jgi:alkylation response protein AidB-like acyl-CoA dehydrogenase
VERTAAVGEILKPENSELEVLCAALAAGAEQLDRSGDWPAEQLQLCADYGVYRWFLAPEKGGMGWVEADLLRGYLRLSAACLTTAFILTQATGALRRVAAPETDIPGGVLEDLLVGRSFTSLGISHLTTSHRHLGHAVLRAEETAEGFLLEGFSPWVTGGLHADFVVIAAELDDGRQILALLPMELPGVSTDPPARLVALTGSHTGAVRLKQVLLERQWLLAGPDPDVLLGASGAKTGGLQTSALAIGHSDHAIRFTEEQAAQREDLSEPAAHLRREQIELASDLLALASGSSPCSGEQLRTRANSLALRSTQAAMATAKGAGYVQGHPAGRLCREALFFLVWSCPQPVMAANMCELAGISD